MDVGGLKGQQVGAYRLEKKLGAGGFGAVYRASQVVRGQTFGTVAVKVLDPDKMGDLHDPLVELRLGSKLDHPNLLRSIPGGMGEAEVEDRDGERGEVVWFAMELAETSLERRLYPQGRRKIGVALSADELLELARDMAAALDHLHERGLIHRDVKPGNILRADGRWKLGDFGVVRAKDSPFTTTWTGSDAYKPHEGINKLQPPHAGWDIWALGVTLVEAAAGRHPTSGLEPAAWERILSGAAPFAFPSLPEPLKSAVAGALTVPIAGPAVPQGRWTCKQILAFLNTKQKPTSDASHIELDDIAQLRRAAEKGDARAQCNLGWRHAEGRGAALDDKEAVRLYRLAAEQGLADAQCYLGEMYQTGRGVTRDDKEAVRYFRLAAEQGHSGGQYGLGWMYFKGHGVARDDKEAARLFHLAAKQGHYSAQFHGIYVFNSTEHDHVGAQHDLGWMFAQRLGMPEEDRNATDRNPSDSGTWGYIGRNELCPCGSGKKFKHCHGVLV